MSRPCVVCNHREAAGIDELLRGDTTSRAVSTGYDLSYDAVARHRRNHLASRARVLIDQPTGALPADDPLDELVAALRSRALAGDPGVVREYRLALGAATARANAAAPVVPYVATTEWHELRTRILEALDPFPAARIAVADALA